MRSRPLLLALLAVVALAALSLVLARGAAYDPWAWISWGREVVHLDLATRGGPAWKPLPVLFTTVFSVFGGAAPDLWIVTARVFSLLAALAAGALVLRVAGRTRAGWAGATVAVLGIAFMDGSYRAAAMATSEGALILGGLLAVERHLAGRYRQALFWGVVAGLVRTEPWPLLLLYGLWLWRRGHVRLAPLVGIGAGMLVLWFVPDWIATGDPLRSSARAKMPDRTSYSIRPAPVGEALSDLFGGIPIFAGIGLVAGSVVTAVREGIRSRTLWPLWVGLAWGGVVLLTIAAGYAGSQRYLMGAIGVLVAAGGVGWAVVLGHGGRMLQGARRPVQVGLGVLATAAAVFCVLSVITRVGNYDRTNVAAGRASAEREELPRIISAAGGADHLLDSCGGIATGAFQPPLVAWYLDAPLKRVRGTRQDVLPVSPTTFQVEGLDVPFQPPLRFGARLLVSGERWRLWSRRCTRRPQAATAGTGNSRRGS